MGDWKIPDGAGYKSCWMVSKSSNRDDIVKNFNLKDTRTVSWNDGLKIVDNYNEKAVMVSDNYDNINYIIGKALCEVSYNDKLLKHLAENCTELYFFYTHRVSDSHGFAKVVNGDIVRKYYYDEYRICDYGDITKLEKQKGWNFAKNFDQCFKDEFTTIDEDHIIEIAQEWTGIDMKDYPYNDVICGSIKHILNK